MIDHRNQDLGATESIDNNSADLILQNCTDKQEHMEIRVSQTLITCKKLQSPACHNNYAD